MTCFQSSHHGLATRVRWMIGGVLLATAGCTTPYRWMPTGTWVADYDTAERRMSETHRDLLIFYMDDRRGQDGVMDDIIKEKEVKNLGDRFVCCTLVKAYEPDRRYIAQFGVERAPALVRVHSDGTFHATTDVLTGEDVRRFVAASESPGEQPRTNPHIPRQPNYLWLNSIDEGRRLAERLDRPMLVVFYRSLTRDWKRIEELLSPHGVYLRLSSMVPVRQRRTALLDSNVHTPYGDLQLPAIVLVGVDGRPHTLELPTSSDAIIQLTDTVLNETNDDAERAPNDTRSTSASH